MILHLLDTPEKSEAALRRFLRASSMNPKGFRKPSQKHGPPRQLTVPDIMLLKVIGFDKLPSRTQSERKRLKAERRKAYLEAVRNNPKYPSGDRRLKGQHVGL